MTQYAKPLAQRAGHNFRDLWARVRKLEARTAGIDSGFPLMALPAVVVAKQTGPPSTVTVNLNGSTTVSGPFEYLASYTPTVNDSVIALPIPASRTYVILGALA